MVPGERDSSSENLPCAHKSREKQENQKASYMKSLKHHVINRELTAEDSADAQFPRIRIKIVFDRRNKVPHPSYHESAWGSML